MVIAFLQDAYKFVDVRDLPQGQLQESSIVRRLRKGLTSAAWDHEHALPHKK
jgi:hypothetical protein